MALGIVAFAHYRLCMVVKEHSAKSPLATLRKFIHKRWWARLDLNQRPRAYQARALTN